MAKANVKNHPRRPKRNDASGRCKSESLNRSTNKKKRKNNDDEQLSSTKQLTDDEIQEIPLEKNQPRDDDTANDLSLATRLRRLRGTAASTPNVPEWSKCEEFCKGQKSDEITRNQLLCLSPCHGHDYEHCRRECYSGFKVEYPEEVPPTIHDAFANAFQMMDDAGLFLHDVIKPGKKRLARTFVTRTLIGNPGTTYKYLGLRLFSHPWCDVKKEGDGGHESKPFEQQDYALEGLGYSSTAADALRQIGKLNRELIKRSTKILKKDVVPTVSQGLCGSANFNLTLVNKMEPQSIRKDLKEEENGLGKTSVGWHKDSNLHQYSTIAVYHLLTNTGVKTVSNDNETTPWKIALRSSNSGRTPALSVPLPSGSLYYLLDDFNHNHDHAVLAGSDMIRYSSTHRVARDGEGSWKYIRDKCRKAVQSTVVEEYCGGSVDKSKYAKILIKAVKCQLHLSSEVEFEWLRQWQIQGTLHAQLHCYWHTHIEELTSVFDEMQKRISLIIDLLQRQSFQSDDNSDNNVNEALYDIVIDSLVEKLSKSREWRERIKDPVFRTIEASERPISMTLLGDRCDKLANEITSLRQMRRKFVNSKKRTDMNLRVAKIRRKEQSNLTKKEQKCTASNWENLKKNLVKDR